MVDIKELTRILGMFTTTELRFWSKVHVPEDPDECWEWQGTLMQHGYGQFRFEGKGVLAHRFVWYLVHGKFTKLFILHQCHNRACVNPSHLREGTHQENMLDMVLSGRSVRENQTNHSKLTRDDVTEIRRLLGEGVAQTVIAGRFGVSQHAISAIKTGKNWKHFKPVAQI